jgi:hypothetical protein
MAKASDYKIVTFQRQPGQRPLGVKNGPDDPETGLLKYP